MCLQEVDKSLFRDELEQFLELQGLESYLFAKFRTGNEIQDNEGSKNEVSEETKQVIFVVVTILVDAHCIERLSIFLFLFF